MAKERKKFKFSGRDYRGVMDELAEDCMEGNLGSEDISLVRHMPEHSMTVFNIRGVSVVVEYSKIPDIYFYMASVGDRGIKPAIEFLEDNLFGEKQKRFAGLYGIELKFEEIKD